MAKRSKPTDDETPPEEKKLTAKEAAFVEYYLVHQNGTLAAQQAGYSQKTAEQIAYENLRKPYISSRVRERLKELQMDADEVHQRLSDHARVDMTDFLTVHEHEYPAWSPRAKYKRGDVIEIDGQAYRALADNTNADPAKDGIGVYWQKTERRKYVDIDLAKAIAEGKGHLIKRAGYNKHGQLEVELVDAQAALGQIGRIHKMFTDRKALEDPNGEPIKTAPVIVLRGVSMDDL
jgi:phage terminase small subunit